MRYAILSDIHSNIEALSAVLDDAEDMGADSHLCCGDIIGYGANPNECIELLKKVEARGILGNHDEAAIYGSTLPSFNPVARSALLWNKEALDDNSREYLNTLPMDLTADGDVQLVHGSPRSIEEYVVGLEQAAQILAEMEATWPDVHILCFGHTHMAMYIGPRAELLEEDSNHKVLRLQADKRYLVNPGSVGQPRDRDWRASYGLYDSETRILEFRRVEYDVASAQKKIIEAGIPPTFALRLQFGI
jgi:predicted phosphodiesterase